MNHQPATMTAPPTVDEYRLDIVTDPEPDIPQATVYFTATDAETAAGHAQRLLTDAAGPDDRYGELYVHNGADGAIHVDTIHLSVSTTQPHHKEPAVERENPDDYPEDPFDHAAWLATPPPPELGPAIAAVIAQIASWDERRRATLRAPDEDSMAFYEAESRVDDAIDEHPIGESPGCGVINSVEPWLSPIRLAVNPSAEAVVKAVAARDHGLISADDFRTLTGWWAAAGLPLPDPIDDGTRHRLVDWWIETGALIRPIDSDTNADAAV